MKTNFKGTEGKWSTRKSEHYPIHEIWRLSENEIPVYIARTCYSLNSDANALLMSKAPEMLEMIHLLVLRLTENDLGNIYAVKKAKQLIKEATEV